ncbi:plastocyanin/azurin family copper-binding protein [Aequorivita marina]|uniref:plastocyanin/azurin family copper-binding protein n=1 Tax=Aequorivita marina TaxID=3073654 RepID=UPI002876CBB3|nr:plastocyanin/azurin family copper-binding protein [Aequorivita sp. S2608]MDS1298805.1 plastocyanin/azurin family copper-binding protein [Aequorivita sp. S2608]
MKTAQKSALILAIISMGLASIFFLSAGFKNTDTNSQKPTTHIVTIHQMKFDPETISVKKGDIVKWVNKDFVPHDVTEKDKKWTSGPLKQGDTFSKVIKQNFDYFCSIHVVMKGSVVVSNK